LTNVETDNLQNSYGVSVRRNIGKGKFVPVAN